MKISRRTRFLGVIGVTIASGWIGVGLNRILGEQNKMESPGTLVWLTAPLTSVLADRALGRNSTPAGWSPALPGKMFWYAVGAALFPAVTTLSLRVGKSMGWVDTSGFNRSTFVTKAGSDFVRSIPKNVFEEAVWRGYLTSELRQRGMRDGTLNVSVGLIWGLWHVPYYLFFLPEKEIRHVLDVPRIQFAGIATATMVAWAVPYTELHRLSGSIWPCVVMHAAEDSFVNPLNFDGHVAIEPDRARLTSPIVGVLPSALYVAAGLAMRRYRLRSDSNRVAG